MGCYLLLKPHFSFGPAAIQETAWVKFEPKIPKSKKAVVEAFCSRSPTTAGTLLKQLT